jgi:crotonobetainyl-CoA:carnitine CoA-transferase CaiB-like acyl-CoA transferase
MATPPFSGLRVLDWTDGGVRLAGRVLAQLGADVVRVRRGEPGPAMRNHPGGVLDWWFHAGTTLADLAPDTAAGADRFRALVANAHVLIEDAAPGSEAAGLVDVAGLRALNPGLVHVSVTPFGHTGPRAHWRASDLTIGALSGILSVSGTPETPLNGWGRQWENIGGLYAVFTALVGAAAVRAGAHGMHFDLSLQQAAISCSEQLLMYRHFMGSLAPRQGALHWTGLYDIVACRDGHVMMTPTPATDEFLAWLRADGMAGTLGDSPPALPVEWFLRAAETMDVMRAWAASRPAEATFHEGQRRGLSFGLVRSVRQCVACPQHTARRFIRRVTGTDVPSAALPFRIGDDAGTDLAPPPAPATVASILARWSPLGSAGTQPMGTRPLAGLRVLDFTWVLAGPKTTRMLADLGADVIKLQTEARAQGPNHNDFPFFLMWNRGKRSAMLDLKQPGATDAFRKLVAQADVVIDNFTPGTLDRLGVGFEAMRLVNPRIAYVAMSGCGIDGPWRDFVTFAPTIQALSGLTQLTNPAGREDVGFGVSVNDHVSGLFGAIATLSALERRRQTGGAQFVDLSQLEVGTYLVGPAVIDWVANEREAQPAGNVDAFAPYVPNEVYPAADGEQVAITARDDREWASLCDALPLGTLAADPALAQASGRVAARATIDAALATAVAAAPAAVLMERLQAAAVPAGLVQNAAHLTDADPQLAARGWCTTLDHATLGPQQHDCFPALIDGERVAAPTAPPYLGQHTFEVYESLAGMTTEEIAIAIGEGVFA